MLDDEIKEIRGILGLDKKKTLNQQLPKSEVYQDSGLGDTSAWEHIHESEINFKVALSHNYKQNAFFQDLCNIRLESIFQYQKGGLHFDMVCDLIKLEMQHTSPEALTEKMRLVFIDAMRTGKKLCFFVGKEKVDFSKFDDLENFPVDYLMDF